MPFKSQAQAKWMFANDPEMAREWASKTKSIKKLPVRKGETPVWEKPDPTKTDKHLSKKKESAAKARARAAGRPYPNLVDNMAVSKGARLDKFALSSAGKRYLKEAPLKENEFWHGTTEQGRESIKQHGFRLADPKLKMPAQGDNITAIKARTTRAGRNKASKYNMMGPGVYLTSNKSQAKTFARPSYNKNHMKEKQITNSREKNILRVAVSPEANLEGKLQGGKNYSSKYFGGYHLASRKATASAAKEGYGGIRWGENVVVSNPKNVKVVNNRYRLTGQTGKDAAVVAAVGGAGYGANKVKKDYSTPAWTRSEGKNPHGGLNAKGRASAKAQGHNLKPPVKSGNNPRRASFLARMGNMPGPEHKPNGEPTRLLLSLNAWGASSKADAKKKAAAMQVNKSMVSPGVYKPARLLSAAERKSVKSGKNYAASHGAAAQARDTKNKAIVDFFRLHNSKPLSGIEINGKKPSQIRRADIERSGLVKIKRNVYVEESFTPWVSNAHKHAQMLPKMRRPTIVMSSNDLPRNVGAAAGNFGSKSSPRIVLVPNGGVPQKLNPEKVMTHEAAHANTKRTFSGTLGLQVSQNKINPAKIGQSKKMQREEARADRFAAKNGGAPAYSYRTMAIMQPIKRRHYSVHTNKLWSKDNPTAAKTIKYGAGTAAIGAGVGAYNVKKVAPRIPGQTSLFSAAEGGLTTPARKLPTHGRWKHLSGQTTPIRIIGPHEVKRDHFHVVDHQDVKRVLHRNQIVFLKSNSVSKSMEYSVVMNQSRFSGASAVGKAFVEKSDANAMHSVSRKGYRLGRKAGVLIGVPVGAAAGIGAMEAKKKVSKAEMQYDQMGNPVPPRKPLMSGNAKLAAAGTGIGLAGAHRMAFASTLPDRLQGQADSAASKVKFQQRLADDQLKRVQNANQIKNRMTRRKQVNLHQYYSDKAHGHLAEAQAKKIQADRALATAPAKKLAHLKSGGALVATGGAMGALAAYNNHKDRELKAGQK